jgi:hypothetical protein
MNYTQLPNWIFSALPFWPNAMTKIVLIVARQTYGYHREFDEISISQFQDWTGLSRQGVISGIKQAIEMGVVRKKKHNDGYAYGLIEPAHVVNSVDQPSQESGLPLVNSVDQPSQLSRPELVNSVDPQKKEKETLKKDSTPLPPNEQKQVGGGGDQTPESLSEQAEQPAKQTYHPESYKLLAQAGCLAAGPMRQAAALPPDQIARLIQTVTASSGGPGAIIRAALDQLALPPELQTMRLTDAPNKPQRLHANASPTSQAAGGYRPQAAPAGAPKPKKPWELRAEWDALEREEQQRRAAT